MVDDTAWHPLFETVLEIDETGGPLSERSNEVVADRDLMLLGRLNRVALSLGDVTRLGSTAAGDTVGYDISLRCVMHPHTGCHFRSAKLLVDLSATPGVVVRDMSPREVRGEHPVELITTVGVGFNFELLPSMVGSEMKRERTAKQTVHHPLIIASGRGFARALWDFRAVQDTDLHTDRELRMIVTAPEGVPIEARFHFKAQVALGGIGRLIPLLCKNSEITQTYRLANSNTKAVR